jgi:hypothetical protein
MPQPVLFYLPIVPRPICVEEHDKCPSNIVSVRTALRQKGVEASRAGRARQKSMRGFTDEARTIQVHKTYM